MTTVRLEQLSRGRRPQPVKPAAQERTLLSRLSPAVNAQLESSLTAAERASASFVQQGHSTTKQVKPSVKTVAVDFISHQPDRRAVRPVKTAIQCSRRQQCVKVRL